MSANGPIKIWRGVSDYVPGMDLGSPDEIMPAPSMLEKGSMRPTIISPNNRSKQLQGSKKRKHGGGKPKKFTANKDEYIEMRRSGLTRYEIAAKYNITIDRLRHRLKAWGIGKKQAELAAMKQS